MKTTEIYQIIKDREQLDALVRFLPDLQADEVYYVSLLARNKWVKTTGITISSQVQLKRFQATKKTLVNKLEQMEVAYGAYMDKGKPIPEDALGVYITPNPRSLTQSNFTVMKELLTGIQTGQILNPYQVSLSALQTNCSKKVFFDLDIDIEYDKISENRIKELRQAIELPATWIRTRGGFHCLIHLNEIPKALASKWYQQVLSLKTDGIDITMNGDNVMPLAGCTQGGFVPHFA
ncbi:MAG: hypothetical protein RIS64_1627 [Bacteroidota bacterium]|jgi:hypothetical protein